MLKSVQDHIDFLTRELLRVDDLLTEEYMGQSSEYHEEMLNKINPIRKQYNLSPLS